MGKDNSYESKIEPDHTVDSVIQANQCKWMTSNCTNDKDPISQNPWCDIKYDYYVKPDVIGNNCYEITGMIKHMQTQIQNDVVPTDPLTGLPLTNDQVSTLCGIYLKVIGPLPRDLDNYILRRFHL
jgi:hypothetical protein